MESYGLLIVIAFVVVSTAMVVLLFYLRECVGRRLRMRRPNYYSLQRSLQRTADDAWQSVAVAGSEQELSTEILSAESHPEAAESRDNARASAMDIAAEGLSQVSYNVPTA